MIIKIDENNIFRIRCNVDSQDEIEWISMTTLYDSTDSGMKADIMVMTTLLENSKYLGLKFKEEAYFQMSSENNMFLFQKNWELLLFSLHVQCLEGMDVLLWKYHL